MNALHHLGLGGLEAVPGARLARLETFGARIGAGLDPVVQEGVSHVDHLAEEGASRRVTHLLPRVAYPDAATMTLPRGTARGPLWSYTT